MKTNYIVLIADKPAFKPFKSKSEFKTFDGPFDKATREAEAVVSLPTIHRVEIEQIEASQLNSFMAKNKEIVTASPSMPMNLIKRMDHGKGPVLEPPGNVTWGIKAIGADSSTFTGKGITVAVLDTGIDATHPCFEQVELEQKNFTKDQNGQDEDGHGTHCAGTIFGNKINGTRIGIAPNIKKALIGKVLGRSGTESSEIIKAIQWAGEKGANIISMSLGIDFPGYVEELVKKEGLPIPAATSIALEDYRKNVLLFEKVAALIKTQSLSGFTEPVLLIAAAGNESNRPSYHIHVAPPAVSDGFISVGALLQRSSKKYQVANFSNQSPKIAAPGVEILSAAIGGGWIAESGTSMAAPHVAGAAVLWAEYLKNRNQFNIDQLLAKLLGTASQTGLEQEDPEAYGAGMVQVPQ